MPSRITSKKNSPRPKSNAAKFSAARFDALANQALRAMKLKAQKLRITGVAVVAYSPGKVAKEWYSKMLAVGGGITGPSKQNPAAGANSLGIAYTKAAEMADTRRDSGSKIRPPKVGEYGWSGGVAAEGRTGLVIAAFSGGPSEDDAKASRDGINVLLKKL